MKNPFDSMSPRAIRAVYAIFALAVLAVCLLNFSDIMVTKVRTNDQCEWQFVKEHTDRLYVTNIVSGGVAERAGLRDGDWLLKIDGVGVMDVKDVNSLINNHRAGEYAVYTIERDRVRMDVRVEIIKLFDLRYLSQFLLGLGFLLVGFFVVLIKPEGSIQRKFGRYGILTMLLFGLSNLQIDAHDPRWKFELLFNSMVLARVVALPVFITFFLHFPVRRRMADRIWFVVLLYALSTLLATPVFLLRLYGEGFLSPPVRTTIGISTYAFFIAGLAIFAHSYFRRVPVAERAGLRHILYAVIVGGAAFLYLVILTAWRPIAVYIHPELFLPVLLIVGIPPAFGYAIVRYRLMDVGIVLRRSLLYGAITAAIAAMYLLIVYGVGTVIGAFAGPADNKVLTVVAFIVIALLFDPLKRRVQDWIDRVFYRERYSAQHALLEFSRELPRMIDLDQIMTLIVERITAIMHIEKIAVVICDEKTGCGVIRNNVPEDACTMEKCDEGLAGLFTRTRAAQSFALRADELDALPIPGEEKRKLVAAGIVLSVPMFVQDTLIGVLHVGPKMSDKLYTQEDVDLLMIVASQAAIAIENARLHLSEIEKQKMDHQLLLARRIQEGLLPKEKPSMRGLDISGVSIPAQSVGGDYFDFIPLSDERLLIAVADVSGKGMPAALYMSKVQGMIQLAAQMYDSPKEILSQVNRRMLSSLEKSAFITMVLALFDTRRGEVVLCRAGHTLPLLARDSVADYLPMSGIGIGLEKGTIFERELEERVVPLAPGQVFVFYSDGVTEMMNPAREEFGEQRLLDLVRGARGDTAAAIERAVIDSIQGFKGDVDQHDDVTLVVVKTV